MEQEDGDGGGEGRLRGVRGEDDVGGGGVGVWYDAGSYLQPNTTYASAVNVTGLSIIDYLNVTRIDSEDWTNVTITESQISDLSHTTDTNESARVDQLVLSNTSMDSRVDTLEGAGYITEDTNASTICSGTTTYLDGEGNCDDISGVYVQSSDWTTIDNYPSACTGFNVVQGIGDTLSCFLLTNSHTLHWNNITSKPANLDTDSTDDVTIGSENLTKLYCGNITGATSNLCTLTDSDTTYTNGTGITLTGTTFSLTDMSSQ